MAAKPAAATATGKSLVSPAPKAPRPVRANERDHSGDAVGFPFLDPSLRAAHPIGLDLLWIPAAAPEPPFAGRPRAGLAHAPGLPGAAGEIVPGCAAARRKCLQPG